MVKDRVVPDTNCLISSFSRRGKFYPIWKGLQEGIYFLCVTNEILNEYQEIIGQKANEYIAENVIQMLLNSKFVIHVEPYFKFHLLSRDPDDNKFVDCAIAANAAFIVSNDKHFDDLKAKDVFPKVDVINIYAFLKRLTESCLS